MPIRAKRHTAKYQQAKESNLRSQASDSSSLMTYDRTGQVDYKDQLDEFDLHYSQVEIEEVRASKQVRIQEPLNPKVVERGDLRSALSDAGYHPEDNPQARTAEWYKMDYEYAQPPVSHLSQN